MKYQLGTALLSGRASVILACQETLYDLQTLFNLPQVKQALPLDQNDPPTSLMEILEEWPLWQIRLPQIVEFITRENVVAGRQAQGEAAQISWRAPLLYPRKLICIGINYKDHIAEMGAGAMSPPAQPYSFFKPATTTLIGSGETFTLPSYAELIDYEAELAVIIGQRAHNVRGEAAMQAVAGYSILNDLSARDWLSKPSAVGVDWVLSKAFDGSAPMGPWITPAEFIPDPQNLRITLAVNGQIKQNSTTANMVFSVQEIIEHLAAIMTLEPGDVIATGTPAGVGYARKPMELLRSGDAIVIEIEELGRLETPVR